MFPSALGDDMARRSYLRDFQLFWLISLVPLLGSLAYLCWRSQIGATS